MDIKQKVEFIMMQLSEVLEELNEGQLTPLIPFSPSIPVTQLTPAVSTLQLHEEQIKQQQIQNNQVVKETAKISQGKWGGEMVDVYEFPSTTV